MNKTNIVLALLAVVIMVLVAVNFSGDKNTTLTGAKFADAYQATENAILLDVRTKGEFEEGHIAGALNIDFQSPAFVSEVQKLDPTKPYFVYCRSGNRSGKAVSIMREAGISNITELKGGIVANGALALVKTPMTVESDYVVDPADILTTETTATPPLAGALSEKEIQGIILMREEEKLARDVYTTLGTQWGARIFSNITRSEETHMDAMGTLVARYGLEDPSKNNTVGVFTSPAMQTLYDELVARGTRSLLDALTVGATVEDLDIRDLGVLMGETQKEDILLVYENLQRGSRNHLRAFVRNIEANGGTYVPAYISEDAFRAIIDGPQERGR